MVWMVWDERLAVGVEQIDAEHRHLLALVNELYDALQSGRSKGVLQRTYAELVDYTLTHFAHEEALMQEADYPGLDAHRRLHAELRDGTLQLQHKAQGAADSLAISLVTMQFLRDWLLHHICGSDRQFAAYLQSQAIRPETSAFHREERGEGA